MHCVPAGNQTKISEKKSIRSEDKLLLSRQEAAALLSISKRSLDYLIANKVLTTRRIGSRVLIPVHDLQRFARTNHPQRLVG
jgi:excisionase family DNA binding protein